MTDYFIWNGVDCRTKGIHVSELPPITIPLERSKQTNVPGRPGSLTQLEGDDVYDDMSLTATCFIADPAQIPVIQLLQVPRIRPNTSSVAACDSPRLSRNSRNLVLNSMGITRFLFCFVRSVTFQPSIHILPYKSLSRQEIKKGVSLCDLRLSC